MVLPHGYLEISTTTALMTTSKVLYMYIRFLSFTVSHVENRWHFRREEACVMRVCAGQVDLLSARNDNYYLPT